MNSSISISSTTNLRLFFDYFDEKGIEWRSVAKRFHFPDGIEAGEHWLPTHHLMHFLSTVMGETQGNVGFEVGQRASIALFSPEFSEALNHCEDMASGIRLLMDVIPRISNHVVIWPDKIEGRWYLCHRGAYPPNLRGFAQAEWFRSFLLLSFCREFLGTTWHPPSVKMMMHQHLTAGVQYQQLSNNISFNCEFGALEIPMAEDYVAVTLPVNRTSWIETLHALFATYAVLPHFNIDWLARLCNTSRRTLQRRLREHGVQFRTLRDQHRCARAKHLLVDRAISPTETAWHCGYSDLSNFNRAFIGWTGITPSQYQKSG
ncbi:helix-turn-helix domain-containing protein [Ferrimonas balearica]|uniref:helix-turn-helix domain-containing protein n=1 Tax=Ferrimonas balearica TaxID=44012 RepID=UPI001C99C1A6|nr:AraC family transcriptional regulator [Ferrimonas balearica]MBY5991365.1 AraC family transcriptional regulator [Ferrimonas balearica]